MVKTIPHSRPTLGQEELDAVSAVVGSGHIAQGEKVAEFERHLADFVGVKGAVVTSSGTAALHVGMSAMWIGSENSVILPSFVCAAPLNAVYAAGAIPEICDIDLDNFNVSFEDVISRTAKSTKAIIVPHMFGAPGDLEKISQAGIDIIEDCAQSLGATYGKRKVGSIGRIGVLSFYANKMMACGEGGALVSDDDEVLGIARDLRDYDEKEHYRVRYNYKMTDIHAALGIEQLKKLPGMIARRKELAAIYSNALKDLDVVLPEGEFDHVYYRYIVRTKKPIEDIISFAAQKGVTLARPVFKPLNRYLEIRSGYTHTDEAFSTALSIPIYPSLTDEEQNRVIEVLREVLSI